MAQYLRYLRIAFCVACGIAAVLLIALWVRSYWWSDGIKMRRPPIGVSLCSVRGALAVSISKHHSKNDSDWKFYESFPVGSEDVYPHAFLGFDFQLSPIGDWTMFIPDWFTLGALGMCGAAAWLRLRFRVQTLLVATAVVAVVLGAVVCAAR